MSGKENSRGKRFFRLPDRGQTSQQLTTVEQDKSPRPERLPPTGGEPSQPAVDFETLLLTDSDAASSVRESVRSTSTETLSISLEGLSSLESSSANGDDEDEEMPFKLPTLRMFHRKSKVKVPTTDSTSVSSLASQDSWSQQESGANGGYVVAKLKDLSKLHKAVWKDDLPRVTSALSGLKKPMYVNYYDKEGRTALHFACARGRVDIVRAVCEAGADPNITDNQGATPLHKLLESGCGGSALSMVLANGADPNLADNLGRTPLHLAAKCGDNEAVRQLLAKGARIDVIEKCGLTPLHISTLNAHHEVVSTFIQQGANIDYQDSRGRTALMMACIEGQSQLVSLLMGGGANHTHKDNEGLTAHTLAMSAQQYDCADILEPPHSQPSKQTSFINNSLLSSVYVPTDMGLGGPATNQIADESVSEELSSPRGGDDSWAATDTEDDLLSPRKMVRVNLRAALSLKLPQTFLPDTETVASSTSPKPVDLVLEGSKGQTTPTNDSPAHYQLDATPPDNDDEASDCSQSINWNSGEDDFDLPDDSPNTSRVAIPEVTETTPTKPPQATPTMETTPIQLAEATPTMGRVSRDSSVEGLLTVDEEISDSVSESNFDSEEDVVDIGGYVPSTPELTPTRSDLLKRDLSGSVKSEAVRAVTSDIFFVSPLSSSNFTSDFVSPDTSGPIRPITAGRRQEVGVVSDNANDEFSLDSDDEGIERLLKEVVNLSKPDTKAVASSTSPKPATPPDNDDEASDRSQSINWDSGEDDFDLPDDSPNTSRVAIPGVTETTPTKLPQATPTIVEVSHDSSMEGLLTVDEEISNSESNFDDMDYKEDVVDIGGYVPSTPELTPTRSDLLKRGLSGSVKSEGVRAETPEQTPTRTGSVKSEGVRAVTSEQTPTRTSSVKSEAVTPEQTLTHTDLSGSVKSEGVTHDGTDTIIVSHLSKSEQVDLSQPAEEIEESDPANEYDDSDWEDFDEEATDDESEDDEPTSISALESMSGAALYDPVLSPQRSKVNKKLEEVKEEGVETTPTLVADDDDTHVSDFEESDVNFDSEDGTLDDLLPADSCLPTSPSDPRDSSSHTCHASSSSSLRNLPPLTLTSRLSPPRLAPLKMGVNEQGRPLSPLKLGPITNEQAHSTKLSQGSSFDSETESEWEREKKEKRRISSSNQFDSGLDTMTTTSTGESLNKRTPSTSVDVEVVKNKNSSVDRYFCSSVDVQSSSMIDSIPSDRPIRPLTSPSSRRQAPQWLRGGRGSLSSTGLDTLQVQNMWSEKPLAESAPTLSVKEEGGPAIRVANEPVSEDAPVVTTANEEAHPVNESPTNEEAPVITPTDEEAPAIAPTDEEAPVIAPTDEEAPAFAPTDEEAPAIAPTDEEAPVIAPTDVEAPAIAPTDEEAPAIAPTDEEAPVIAPTNEVPLQPSNESILSEVSEDLDYDDDVSVDFSNTNIAHVEGATQFLLGAANEATPTLKPHPLTKPKETLLSEEVKLKPNILSLSKKPTPSKTTPGLNIEALQPNEATLTTSSPRVAKGQSLTELKPLFEEDPIDSESLATGHTHQPALGYPLTVSQLHASPGYTSLLTVERVGGLVPELSLSELSGSLDNQSSHEMLSQSSKMSDDLPLSHLLRLNQSLRSSGGGVASLLDSAHTVRLEESLIGATHELECSKNEALASMRMQHELQSQLDHCQVKYNTAISSKMSLENIKLDLELQVRELKYQLDQSRESVRSHEGIRLQLREQLDRIESRVSREIDTRQSTELKYRELEVAHRSLCIANQTLGEKLVETESQLHGEREAKSIVEGLYKEQSRLYEALKEESHRTRDVKSQLSGRLEQTDKTKQDLQSQVSELTKTITQLTSQLTSEKLRAEEVKGQLETARTELALKIEGVARADNSLAEVSAQFESSVREVNEKADFLSSALDKEAELRSLAQEEALSLKTRLDSTLTELSTAHTHSRLREEVLSQQLQGVKQDILLTEKDLDMSRNLHSQQCSKTEALEAKLQDAEKEVKVQSTLLFERANQIAALQRDVDHGNSRMTSLEETIQERIARYSTLELQLAAANEKIASLQSEGVALRQHVEYAQRRVEEKEQNEVLSQQRFDNLLSTLRTEYEKSKAALEERCSTLTENVSELREEVVRRDEKMAAIEREIEELNKQISRVNSSCADVQQRLDSTELSYTQLEVEKNDLKQVSEQLEAKIGDLTSDLISKIHEASLLGEKVGGLHTSIGEAHDTTRVALDEKQSAFEQKLQMEAQLQEAYKKVSNLEAELESDIKLRDSMESKLTHLQEMCSTMQTHLSETQTELNDTQVELECVKSARDKALAEAEEARYLWEGEVRSKSKLGVKLMEMEKGQLSASGLVDAEKRRTKKALELKKEAEWKLEVVQREAHQLSSQVTTARAQLKLSRKRTHQLELNQSKVPELRADYDRDTSMLRREMEGLQHMVSSTQSHYKREIEKRHTAEQCTSKVRHELEELRTQLTLGKSESQSKRKELLKSENKNRRLKEELRALQSHVTNQMISKTELEDHKKLVEEKAQRELSYKLEEVNHHLEQQSQAQDNLVQLRLGSETEQRDKLSRSANDMQFQLGKVESDKQIAVAGALRYKELYQSEVTKSAHLGSQLQRAKDNSVDYQNKLSLERHRTQKLLDVTVVGSLTPPLPTHYTEPHPHSSTPHRLTPPPSTNIDLSPTNSLLSTVRSKLDESIARHRHRVLPTTNTIGTATRSTYTPRKTSLDSLPLSKQAHLDAIKRHYRI